MSKTFDQGKEEVVKLCEHFTINRQAFFAPGVKEAHIRKMLINPFFEALGWDVRSAAMVAPQYQEVIFEDSLDVEGQQKAPDYTFRVGTLRKFYALSDTKRLSVLIAVGIGVHNLAEGLAIGQIAASDQLSLAVLLVVATKARFSALLLAEKDSIV